MAEKLYDYDPAKALKSDEAVEVFLADAFETGVARYIAKSAGMVARAKGMTKAAFRAALRQAPSCRDSGKAPISGQILKAGRRRSRF